MKKLSSVSLLFLLVLVIMSNTNEITSAGAPPGSTGAPGEKSCGFSSCHTGVNNINTGTGQLQILFNGGNNDYEPGKTYPVTITLSKPGIVRFGFQSLVLNGAQHNCGTLEPADPVRTQVLAGGASLNNRNYVTYTAAGTNPYASGMGQWTFNWKAPDTDEGPVHFYFAGVAANNDGTDKGDEVYTGTLQVSSIATGMKPSGADVYVYPSVWSEQITVRYINTEKTNTRISIVSLAEAKEIVLWEALSEQGNNTMQFVKPGGVTPGVYILRIQQNDHAHIRRIILQ